MSLDPDVVTFISIVRWRHLGVYEWNGLRYTIEDEADIDPASPDYEIYVGRLHGDKLVSAHRHGDTPVSMEPAWLWLAHVAHQIGLEAATL